jgi:hypothetical protein
MDGLVATRRSLHGVAEPVLAGPQYRRCGSVELRATPGGFGTVAQPDLRVDRTDLVAGGRRLLAEPYAYVGPWTMQPSELWNAPFGAVRPMTDLNGADGVLAFFAEIRAALTPSGSAPPQPGTAR